MPFWLKRDFTSTLKISFSSSIFISLLSCRHENNLWNIKRFSPLSNIGSEDDVKDSLCWHCCCLIIFNIHKNECRNVVDESVLWKFIHTRRKISSWKIHTALSSGKFDYGISSDGKLLPLSNCLKASLFFAAERAGFPLFISLSAGFLDALSLSCCCRSERGKEATKNIFYSQSRFDFSLSLLTVRSGVKEKDFRFDKSLLNSTEREEEEAKKEQIESKKANLSGKLICAANKFKSYVRRLCLETADLTFQCKFARIYYAMNFHLED